MFDLDFLVIAYFSSFVDGYLLHYSFLATGWRPFTFIIMLGISLTWFLLNSIFARISKLHDGIHIPILSLVPFVPGQFLSYHLFYTQKNYERKKYQRELNHTTLIRERM